MTRATQVGTARRVPSGMGLSPALAGLSRPSPSARMHALRPPYYPAHAETRAVWAVPRSLATTGGITLVFSSCGY